MIPWNRIESDNSRHNLQQAPEVTATAHRTASAGASGRNRTLTPVPGSKRIRITPQKPRGRLTKARGILSLVLLGLFFVGPFLRIDGYPLFLLNFPERKFYLLGAVFWPQDLHLFGLAAIIVIIFIIMFTAVFGRLFCGWLCPQTVFMEMVFRRLEYWIEGDGHQQRKLNAAPWSPVKLWKKGLKHTVFLGISFVTGNFMLAYIIGSEALLGIIREPPSRHLPGLTAMILFSLAFYGVFARLREQVCLLVCPYGRLQDVLLDDNSIVVQYDFKRGEPRAKITSGRSSPSGDCVDCHRCIQVCPTGIDIRHGTQLECIHCSACIDACNAIMDKLGRERGLLRYTSLKAIQQERAPILTTWVLAYAALLLGLAGVFSVLLANRAPLEAGIYRTPGALSHRTGRGTLQNLYSLTLVNKTAGDQILDLKPLRPETAVITSPSQFTVPANNLTKSAFVLEIPVPPGLGTKLPVTIGIYSGTTLVTTVNTTFLTP